MIDINNPHFTQDIVKVWGSNFRNKQIPVDFIPNKKGIYMFVIREDGKDKILYIGKAKKLRNRLLKYYTGEDFIRVSKPILKKIYGEILPEQINFGFIVYAWLDEFAESNEVRLISKIRPEYNNIFSDFALNEETNKRLLLSIKANKTIFR